jgi:hypothetical protein
MALRLTFDAQLDNGDDFLLDQIGPVTVEETGVVGPALRRTVTLAAGTYVTLDPGEITPYFWTVYNAHASGSLYVGFGQSNHLTLAPGQFAAWFGSEIPFASGAGAESKIMYWVVAQS